MEARAAAIAAAGDVDRAMARGTLPRRITCTLSEGLVIGLLKQGVRKYLAIFGHGSTDLAEALRVYEAAGVVRTFNFRNEVAMSHAASALRWQYDEQAAVVTSIGPGALQAMAGSLAAASNGIGVWHVYGDETTHDEGCNMQQIPKHEQGLYGRLTAVMGESYVLHTPEALRSALRRGSLRVNHPFRAGPFYLMLPINTQPQTIRDLNLAALPERLEVPVTAVAAPEPVARAAAAIRRHRRVVIKAGGGTRRHAAALARLAELADGVVVLSPGSLGVLPDAHPRNMHVGGSKGSISGNFAMAEADLLIAVGTRAVCQSDCSGIGYPRVRTVVNINGDFGDLAHYNRTIMLPGDVGCVMEQLVARLASEPPAPAPGWIAACGERKRQWVEFKNGRLRCPPLHDPVWSRPVLTQPVAIHAVLEFARSVGATSYFDAGDVQANGFQIAADDTPLQTITEAGASYMGFAASAIVASAIADRPRYAVAVCGDGSFLMNPQVLADGVHHRLKGMVVILDNRRMGAISGLQQAQYGAAHATSDNVAVDYVAMARSVEGVFAIDGGGSTESLAAALRRAHAHPGLSVVQVRVYYGDDPRGGMGAHGAWNVGNWVGATQARYHDQDL
ncbi:MAG: thiamine pyrophosphate-dependent enzyme [Alphaproteobacteria bacterium]|nr:thiamine pyrophosphate-dependent enzyme [Alphaproteobacteria bacterium]